MYIYKNLSWFQGRVGYQKYLAGIRTKGGMFLRTIIMLIKKCQKTFKGGKENFLHNIIKGTVIGAFKN